MISRLLVVLGTRPEAIKLAPLIRLARRRPHDVTLRVVHTGQHREMAQRAFEDFQIHADVDLDLMRPGQQPAEVLAAALPALQSQLLAFRPHWVVVQGDTMSTLAGAMAGFYAGISVAHVEAGLRSGDMASPFPEEMNRTLVTQLATLHFAPTARARDLLLTEGVPGSRVRVTGNTAIDALLLTAARSGSASQADDPASAPRLLLTTHRRENHGERMMALCAAVHELLERYPQAQVLAPMHPSPAVRAVLPRLLGEHPRVRLVEPLPYAQFVQALQWSTLVLTDSGGIVEEAPSLKRPVVILRDTTERPEAVETGHAVIAGTDTRSIVRAACEFIDGVRARSSAPNPFGDGHASERILETLLQFPDGVDR